MPAVYDAIQSVAGDRLSSSHMPLDGFADVHWRAHERLAIGHSSAVCALLCQCMNVFVLLNMFIVDIELDCDLV